jgi:hypothetical protein
LDQIGSGLDHFQTEVRAAAHPVSFIWLTGFVGGNVAQQARRSRRTIVIAKMAFALAYLLIAAGGLLVLTGLIAAALHRNALHSIAAV